MNRFRVAAVQMNALKDDLDHNLDVHATFIRKAAAKGCRLVLFPELSVTAHYGSEEVVQFAEEAGRGRIWDVIAGQAKEHQIVVSYGFCELAHGTHYNSQALVGPRGLVGIQRKVHASKDEYFSFRMGRSLDVFSTGFCRVGTLICYDSFFSEAWRVLTLKGAEIILAPHASRSGWGKKVPKARQVKALKSCLSELPGDNGTYAKRNGVFAVFANQVDYNGHSTHAGGAYVIDPSGKILTKSRAMLDDQMITAEIDPKELSRARRSAHYVLKTRRPEIYKEITRMI